MNNKPEHTADISAELRTLSRGAKLYGLQPTVYGKPINIYFAELADRLDAASLGNVAKLRDVVEDLLYMAKRFAAKTPATETVIFDSKTHETLKTINYHKTIEKAEAALAAPARECDVGTPAEQTARFAEFCKSHRHSDMPKCAGCPLEDIPDGTGCSQAWGQMPCNESGATSERGLDT